MKNAMKKKPVTVKNEISRAYFRYCADMNKRGTIPQDRQTWENIRADAAERLMEQYP